MTEGCLVPTKEQSAANRTPRRSTDTRESRLQRLRVRLVHPTATVRNAAIESVGALGALELADDVARVMLSDSVPYVRATAAETLGYLGAPRTLSALWRAFEHDHTPFVRAYAASSIGRFGTTRAASRLKRRLAEERNVHVRFNILAALYRMGDHRAGEALVAALQRVRWTGGVQLLNCLLDLTDHPRPADLQRDAKQIVPALRRLGEREPLLAGTVRKVLRAIDFTRG